MKAAIIGVTGYTGQILLHILDNHPHIHSIIPISSSAPGKLITDLLAGFHASITAKMSQTAGCTITVSQALDLDIDVVFSALPHLKSAEICAPFFSKSVIIDLSADFRIDEPGVFKTAYGCEPPRLELLDQAVYGLCEWYPSQIIKKNIIANPGCYPTASLLPLLPLVKEKLIEGPVIINALSGISGAGKKLAVNYLFSQRVENCAAYLPGSSHRHSFEIKHELNKAGFKGEVCFTPHLVPMKRGIAVTTTALLNQKQSKSEILALLEQYYQKTHFIKILKDAFPQSNAVWGSNRCDIGVHVEDRRLYLFSVIDNLIKGASGQAVQNMNIRFGFEQTCALPVNSQF